MTTMVGWKAWQSRINGLRAQAKANPLCDEFLLERFGLELAFGDIHKRVCMPGKAPWPARTIEEYRLYSFLATAVRIHARLTPRGQKTLTGAIRACLEKEFGLDPLAFELRTAAHLMARGFELCFHDLEAGGGYDFLARSGETVMEVECKHISGDIGRQIHRKNLYNLGGVLLPFLKKALRERSGGCLIDITIPGRLTNNIKQQELIAHKIEAVLFGDVEKAGDDKCVASIRPFPLRDSPFAHNQLQPTRNDLEDFVAKVFGINNSNFLVVARPGRTAVVVNIKSIAPDKVLSEMLKRLKHDVKQQFSGRLPALLCVHFADLTHDHLLELAKAERQGTGIKHVVNLLMHRRPQLHTVSLMVDGDLRIENHRTAAGVQTSVQETGPCYVFRNPNHPQSGVSTLDDIFPDRLL